MKRCLRAVNGRLKQISWTSKLLLGAGLLCGSAVLLKRYFFYEEEHSLAEEMIKNVAENAFSSIAEYCISFHLPYDVNVLKKCYSSEVDRLHVENYISIKFPATFTHEGSQYLIGNRWKNEEHSYSLIRLVL
jgi:hypothetical protein